MQVCKCAGMKMNCENAHCFPLAYSHTCILPHYPNHLPSSTFHRLFAQAIGEAQHEIALDGSRAGIFDIVIVTGPGDADVLVQDVKDAELEFPPVVFQEQFAD